MYAEQLTTPHPFHASTAHPRELLTVIETDAIKAHLAEVRIFNPDFYEDAALATADYILDQVSDTLWFPERNKHEGRDDFAALGASEPPTWEDLGRSQAADCYGYTVVASECLESVDIAHYIGFANGHATLVLPFADSGHTHLRDPLSPHLSQEITAMVGEKAPESIETAISKFGKAALFLNTYELAATARGETHQLLARHPWLTFSRGGQPPSALTMGSGRGDLSYSDQQYKVLMSAYAPETGRSVLHNYKSFRQAIENDDYEQAAQSLRNMSGLYPDIDARKPQKDIKATLKSLSAQGRSDLAHDALDDYFGSFSISGDTRHVEAYADCLRLLALHEGDLALASLAVKTYERAMTSPRAFRNAIAGKLGKALALQSRLELHAEV